MASRTIVTTQGKITLDRCVLRRSKKSSKTIEAEKLETINIFPLDIALGIDNLPYKLTVRMMLDIAKEAINAKSFKDVEYLFRFNKDIQIGATLIRDVTNFVGNIVFKENCKLANEAKDILEK